MDLINRLEKIHAFLSGAFICSDNAQFEGVLEDAMCQIHEIIIDLKK